MGLDRRLGVRHGHSSARPPGRCRCCVGLSPAQNTHRDPPDGSAHRLVARRLEKETLEISGASAGGKGGFRAGGEIGRAGAGGKNRISCWWWGRKNRGARDAPQPTTFLARPRHAFAVDCSLSPTGTCLNLALSRACPFKCRGCGWLRGGFVIVQAMRWRRANRRGPATTPKPAIRLDCPPKKRCFDQTRSKIEIGGIVSHQAEMDRYSTLE